MARWQEMIDYDEEIEEDSKRIEKWADIERCETEHEFWKVFSEIMQGSKKNRGRATKRQKETIGSRIVQRKFSKDPDDWYKYETKFGWRDARTGRWVKAPTSQD